ncbi:DNA ligase D [Polaromonas sp.]|uniref:DNA ligase D n=1 Tax=Polaromonas sp. TaxID=1869339 RepID=UPI003264D402
MASRASKDALQLYKAKRNFALTSEPSEGGRASEGALSFVVQKHWASRLHYDFRLELDGTMKSWAVPKGPSYDPADKRMAVEVEDHPISYSSFEGTIPPKQYGAGKVIIWDKGKWQPEGDPRKGLRSGNLKFQLHGHKLQGKWVLVRMKGRGEKQAPWLLIKEKDALARPAAEFSVVDELPDSVKKLPGPEAEKAAAPKPASAKDGKVSKAAKSGLPEGAVRAALPAKLAPQLATLVDGPPADPENWVYEIKFDGYRLLARIHGKDIQLFTRNGNDWTDKLQPLHKALAQAKLPDGWYDGEIVVLNADGVPDFGALQLAFDVARPGNVVYYLFDVPFFDGHDLRAVPLEARRALLEMVLADKTSDKVRFSAVFDASAESVVTSACRLGLEGVIGKRRDASYQSRRSGDWIKLKCSQRQEFVIGGYTDPQGGRTGIGSLLLGVHDAKGKLQYAGNVGTGFSQARLRELKATLSTLSATKNPFAEATGIVGKPHWVRPKLVAEVTFGEWTRSGRIRHSVFHGLRTDKDPKVIVREKPVSVKQVSKPGKVTESQAHALSSKVRVSNPERVIDPSTGITKMELVRYYDLVGEVMIPHLRKRPVALVRAPAGITGQLFFQKHAETDKLPGIEQLDPALYPGHPPLLEVANKQGLLSGAQWNVVELHTFNTGTDSLQRADRMIFDLDPGEGVGWPAIVQGTELMHSFLEQLGLASFLKTSGGKGLHVVVPLRRVHDWEVVRGFSEAIVQHLAQTIPQLFVAKSGPKNRVGKIFIDYLRNGIGSTTVCAWSARARPGMGISVPLAWSELAGLKSASHWTLRTVQTRLDQGNEPWKTYAKSAQTLTAAMKKLGYRYVLK